MHPGPRPLVRYGYRHAGINQPWASFVTSSPRHRSGVYYFAISSNHLPAFSARAVKYAYRDLIRCIPAQIRPVSVRDYPGNSCNAAPPQLISPADERRERESYSVSFAGKKILIRSIRFGMQNRAVAGYLFIFFSYISFWSRLNGLLCIYHGPRGSGDWGEEPSYRRGGEGLRNVNGLFAYLQSWADHRAVGAQIVVVAALQPCGVDGTTKAQLKKHSRP